MGRIEELFRIDGKVAVVSGGAGLIGAALADILAEAGASVVIADSEAEKAESEARRLAEKHGGDVVSRVVDIANEEAVADLASEVSSSLGQPDILVNAAHYKGGSFFHSLGEYPKETWDRVLDVNLSGTFLMCREFGRRMFDGEGGTIVNISSTYGVVSADPRIYGESGINSPVAYAATKSGLLNLTRYMAIHWRPKVRANVLVPGGVEAGQDPGFIQNYEYRTPLGRMALHDDYQGAVLFMCSDASSYMTGATVVVDGGWTAW
jgi:NAD(P)-dependent dehydrogenase (short-subunit alcohol dehydrogenase family)